MKLRSLVLAFLLGCSATGFAEGLCVIPAKEKIQEMVEQQEIFEISCYRAGLEKDEIANWHPTLDLNGDMVGDYLATKNDGTKVFDAGYDQYAGRLN